MTGDGQLTVGVLGSVEVRRGGDVLSVGGTKQRSLLAVLALDPGRVASCDRLIGSLWGEDPPPSALNAIQVYASNLRKVLGDVDGQPLLRWRRPGYLLDIRADQVDLAQFETLTSEAMDRRQAGHLVDGSRLLGEALALWRGPALADVADEPFAGPVVTRLEALRLQAFETWCEVELELGRHATVIGPLQSLVSDHPLRENLRALLMLALYRSGRQAEALEVYRDARAVLAAELGLDPGTALRELERAVLAHSPTLDLPVGRPAPGRWDPTLRVPKDTPVITAWLLDPAGTRMPLDGARTLVGRGGDCDIVLSDALSSRRHAMVRTVEDRHEIIDLESTNGTQVNAVDLPPHQAHPLAEGDVIRIGQTVLEYVRQ